MFRNLSVLLPSLLVCVLFAEAGVRSISPSDLKGVTEKTHTKHLTIDPDFGVRPIMGKGRRNEFGTLVNSYSLEKPDNVERLLFSGDSVTRRAKIVESLRRLYGEEE